ncbi:MAG: hypothetical protein Q7R47_03710 [Candidatus Diapherotrites archaeon]|nr:hypothetical protein [Candidatus Diapherotrites archaeon]
MPFIRQKHFIVDFDGVFSDSRFSVDTNRNKILLAQGAALTFSEKAGPNSS